MTETEEFESIVKANVAQALEGVPIYHMRETKEGVTTLFRSKAIEEHRITAQGVNVLLRNACEILGRAIINKGGRVFGIWGTLKT